MFRRVNYVYTINDCYREYKKVTEKATRLPLSKFKELYTTFVMNWVEKAFDKGNMITFPYHIGSMYIVKEKKKLVDIRQTVIQKKRVYFNNDNTGGYSYFIKAKIGKLKYSWAYKAKRSIIINKFLFKKILNFIGLGKYYPAWVIEP